MAAATATLSDPTRPGWGMYATASATASSACEQPWSSWPTARQTSPFSGASCSGTAPVASSMATTRSPIAAAALAAATGPRSGVAAPEGARGADDGADVERLADGVEQHGKPGLAGPAPLPVQPLDLGRPKLARRAGPGDDRVHGGITTVRSAR